MKKFILISFIFLGLTFTAHAQIVPFDYTGFTAEDTQEIGWESGPDGAIGFVGGPTASEHLGSAQQFTIDTPTDITALESTFTIIPGEGPGTTAFTYNIYTNSSFPENPNSPVPNIYSLTFTSQPITLSVTQQQVDTGQTQIIQELIPFNSDLQPGTYWLSEEGSGDSIVEIQQSYIPDSSTATVPEPLSMWLMFMGLMVIFYYKLWNKGSFLKTE